MYAIFDTDSSFFNLDIDNSNITNDVIELSVVEEVGQLLHGQLTLYDPIWYYAKVLLAGKTFNLSFGYKNRNESMTEIMVKTKNPQEVSGLAIRSGIKGIVTMPKYIFSEGGRTTFNCGFFGYEYGEDYKEVKIYNSGTKEQLIQDEMKILGVSETKIDFQGQTDSLQKMNIMKNEKSYKFLLRLAKDWRCTFILARNKSGNLIGAFIDTEKVASQTVTDFFSRAIGATGSKKLFEFGFGATNPNVINGEIVYNVGDSGQGDHITFNIVGNKTVVTRYVTQDGKTIAYKLNEAKIRKFAEEREGDFTMIMSNVMKAQDMDSIVWQQTKVKDFFTQESISTAPQGVGYSGNLNLIGDPTLCIPTEIKFGEGFPPQLKQPQDDINRIFLKKIEHNLSNKGYLCRVEISDAITAYNAYVEGEG